MARSYGANATLAGKLEATYGTAPSGDYESLPFISSSLGSEQGLIESDVLGQGRDPLEPIRDVIRVEGRRRRAGRSAQFRLLARAAARAPDHHRRR